MYKVGAVVVTYRPTQDVFSNITKTASQVDVVCVVDNTESDIQASSPVSSEANVIYVNNGANKGIAAALNQGIDTLVEMGVDSFFLFDQDSVLPERFVANMLAFRSRTDIKGLRSQIIVAPNFVDINSQTSARFAVLKGWRYRSVMCGDTINAHLIVNFAITSGTLISREIWDSLGRFRDDYFIDHVDSEYCLRAAGHGIRIVINCDTTMSHAIGQRSVHKLLGMTIKPNHHSHIRRYYITRNGIRMMLDYGRQFPSLIGLSFARLVHELLSVVLYEKNRGRKLWAMWRGLLDGILGRMGPVRFG